MGENSFEQGGLHLSGPDIFISYCSEDRNVARRYAQRFVDEGFTVWWDAALHSGETFDEVIETALKAAKAVVVLWSPRSVGSRWVRAEATLADRRNKLAPVTIESCDRPIIFELTHTADLTKWKGDASDPTWRSFVKDLHRLVDKSNESAAIGSPARSVERTKPAAARIVETSRPVPTPSARQNGSRGFGGGGSEMVYERLDRRADARAARRSPEPAEDEGERTQFYTGSGGFEAEEVHCLELNIDDQLEKRYIISDIGLKIGRAAPADIILSDARVSRTHCLVELTDGEVQVSDMNSTNGTYIDGERIHGSATLEVGSTLKVGNVSFVHEVRTRSEV